MRRPLVGIALVFIIGTWLGLHLSVASDLLLFMLLVFSAISVMCRLLHSKLLTLLISISILFASWLFASLRENNIADSLLADWQGEQVEIVGVIAGDPIVRISPNKKMTEWRFPVDVISIKETDQILQHVKGQVDVCWRIYGIAKDPMTHSGAWQRSRNMRPAYGQKWKLSGYIDDYNYGERQARHFVLKTSIRKSRYLSSCNGVGIASACYSARHRAAAIMAYGMESHDDVVSLCRAMLLGYRTSMPKEAQQLFRATGTIHIFAISGLHVGIFAMFIVFILRLFRISRVYWVLFLAPLLIAYTFATGARASAIRACIMAITCFLAPLIGRRTDVPCALSFAALLILIIDPYQLLDIGFIYSFVVVSWLIALYPQVDMLLSGLWKADPLQLQNEQKWVQASRRAGGYVCSLISLSLVAWLASAPLTAYFFGRFVPIALLCNIVVIPLAFLIVLTGCLSLLSGSCILLVANLFNHISLALVSSLVWFMKLMVSIPYASINITQPPLWSVFLWYGILGLICWIGRKRT